ncbi:MAG: T9SS type A sorting domain-containing protein [Bacteroidota bacterium]
MRNNTWRSIHFLVIICVGFLSHLSAQSTEDYFIQSAGQVWATHNQIENDALVNFQDNIIVWGTTVETGPRTSEVFLQGLNYPFTGFSGQVFSGIYDNNGCVDENGLAHFNGMVLDENNGQVIVASTYEFRANGTFSNLVIFSVDIFSGTVLWTFAFHPYGDVTDLGNVRIILDDQEDVVVAFDFRETPTEPRNTLGILKLDLGGSYIFSQNYEATFPALTFCSISDIYDDGANNRYVLSGEYNHGGNSEPYFFQVDRTTGAVTSDIYAYDILKAFGGFTGDGTSYFAAHQFQAGNELGVVEIDPATGNILSTVTYDLPVSSLGSSKTSVEAIDMDFNPHTRFLDLLVEYFDGLEFSYGNAHVDATNLMLNAFHEFDFDPGGIGGIPIAYNLLDVAMQSPNPTNDWIVLAHPQGINIPGGPPAETITLNNYQVSCIGPFSESPNTQFQNNPTTTLYPVGTVDGGGICEMEVFRDVYQGDVFDCNGVQLGTFRRGQPTAQVAEPLDLKISWYPNPASDQIEVAIKSTETPVITIIDRMGRTVSQKDGQGTLNVSHLAAGLYTLKVAVGSQSVAEPIVIQR